MLLRASEPEKRAPRPDLTPWRTIFCPECGYQILASLAWAEVACPGCRRRFTLTLDGKLTPMEGT